MLCTYTAYERTELLKESQSGPTSCAGAYWGQPIVHDALVQQTFQRFLEVVQFRSVWCSLLHAPPIWHKPLLRYLQA